MHLCAADGERRLEARRLGQRLPLGGALYDVQLQYIGRPALALLQRVGRFAYPCHCAVYGAHLHCAACMLCGSQPSPGVLRLPCCPHYLGVRSRRLVDIPVSPPHMHRSVDGAQSAGMCIRHRSFRWRADFRSSRTVSLDD